MNPKTNTDRFICDDELYYSTLWCIVFILATKEIGSIEFKLIGTVSLFSVLKLGFAFKANIAKVDNIKAISFSYLLESKAELLSVLFSFVFRTYHNSKSKFLVCLNYIKSTRQSVVNWRHYNIQSRYKNTFQQPTSKVDLKTFSTFARLSVLIIAMWMASHSYNEIVRDQFGKVDTINPINNPF